MKRFLLTVAVLLCSGFAFAQRFSFGAGYVRSSVQEMIANVENATEHHNGAFAEIGYDAPINRYLSGLGKLQAGSLFEKSGSWFAKVPVLAKAIAVSDMDFKLFVYLGPEFSYRIGYDDIRKRPYNVWLAGGAGLDLYNRFRIHLGYEHDFINEFTGEYANYLGCHSTDFSVGLSVLF